MKLNVATEAKPRLAVRPGRCRPYNKKTFWPRPSGRLLSPGQLRWPRAVSGPIDTAAGRLLDLFAKTLFFQKQ